MISDRATLSLVRLRPSITEPVFDRWTGRVASLPHMYNCNFSPTPNESQLSNHGQPTCYDTSSMSVGGFPTQKGLSCLRLLTNSRSPRCFILRAATSFLPRHRRLCTLARCIMRSRLSCEVQCNRVALCSSPAAALSRTTHKTAYLDTE